MKKKTLRIRLATMFYRLALWLWDLGEEEFIEGMYEGLFKGKAE